MSRGEEEQLARLREAFAALAEGAPPGALPAAEKVWRAAHGELTAAETAELAELAARDPETAEAWRLALELKGSPATAEVIRLSAWRRRRWGLGLAAAAVLVVGIMVPLLTTQPWHGDPRLRNAGPPAVESRVGQAEALPRERFLLRWSGGPDGSLYDVVVSDGDLNVLHRSQRLAEPQLLVPAAALESLAPGATVLWRVEVLTPDGSRQASATFVQRVR